VPISVATVTGGGNALLCAPDSNGFCNTTSATLIPSGFGVSYASSLNVCQQDPNTKIKLSNGGFTYDLMSSTSLGCYPITGTVEYSVYSATDAATCDIPHATTATPDIDDGSSK